MTTSLYDQLGGETNLKKIVDDFVDLAIVDPKVNYSRNGKYRLDIETITFSKKSAFEFISSAAGGPHQYIGKTLKEIHTGMKINDNEFDAITLDFRRALEKNNIRSPLLETIIGMVEYTRSQIVELST